MDQLSKFLTRFKKIGVPEQELKEKIAGIISMEIGVPIESNRLNYRNGVVHTQVDSVIKSELFLRKEIILEKIRQKIKKEGVFLKVLDLR